MVVVTGKKLINRAAEVVLGCLAAREAGLVLVIDPPAVANQARSVDYKDLRGASRPDLKSHLAIVVLGNGEANAMLANIIA